MIGGFYNRPLALANTLHFVIVLVILVKASLAADSVSVWVFTAIYVIFAAWFGKVLFTPPKTDGSTNRRS